MGSKTDPRKFEVGTTVMGRWPKSNLYFQGTVVDYNDVAYLVKFDDEDGSEFPIKFKDVTTPFTSTRSRSRSRGRSPAKSPSRKSPSRKSPGRKSPARKSPARKSPGRPKKKSTDDADASDLSFSPSSKKELKEDLDVSSKSSEKQTIIEQKEESNFSSTVRSRPVISAIRQSTRIASLEKNKVGSSNDGNMINNSLKIDTQSIVKAVQTKSKLSKVSNYFQRFANCLYVSLKSLLLALMVTFLPVLLNQMCTKKKCELFNLADTPRKLSNYYDQKVLFIVGGFLASLVLLALLPIGKLVKTKSESKIRCNGYISLLVLLGAIPILLKLDYNIISLYQLFRHFMVSFTALGMVFSVILYVKSYFAKKDTLNPHGNTGYYLVDFVEGRELSPRIGSFDIKFFLFRMSLLLMVIINVFVVLKSLQLQSQSKVEEYSLPLFVICTLQIFYVLDLIWFEESYLTTYEYMKQGGGFLVSVGYLSMPFLMTLYSRYVLNHRPTLPWYCLVGIVAIYLVGYIILRGANSQKHAFRVNPADPALAHLESLPTTDGKRLLVSGCWGVVRHPNYIGDIIIQLSWALVCGFSHAMPWVVFGFSFLFLLARIYIVEDSCRRKYGLAWSSYVSRVSYRLIPKVF